MYRFDSSRSTATAEPVPESPPACGPLSAGVLARMKRYWQAANYLTVGQIYLRENPLLREPLTLAHIKPRLLGHWGTSPGLNLIYVQLNRLIQERNAKVIYLVGPGHGGPAIVGNVWLEGTYSEIYPHIGQDAAGMRALFRQFSTPGGVPSHVSVQTPGSIHEGGELGYVLTHAFGAAFDNPDLIVAAVVGDGEAETGPLAGSWKGTSFLNPVTDGAVLPIFHLNGYKIANPTVWSRSGEAEVENLLRANGYEPHVVAGDDPDYVFQRFAAVLDACYERISQIQIDARMNGVTGRPAWPAIILRTPKGWTGPDVVDGKPVTGTWRSHQVPLAGLAGNPEHLAQLETWLRSYEPDTLFDDHGRLLPDLTDLAPEGDLRMGANPVANGGRVLIDLDLPDFRDYALAIPTRGSILAESPRSLGAMLRDTYVRTAATRNFRLFSPDEANSNRLGDVFTVENRTWLEATSDIDDHLAPDGRVMEVLSEHLCEGWLEGYLLTGRHGLFATYEAFAMVAASMIVQHTKWLQEAIELPWRAPVASLNILLTSTCWRNDHNGFSHQGPGLLDVMLSKRGTVARIYLPPDANCLLSVADHCLRSRDYVNLIIQDKQPQLQYLSMEEAIAHCERGASIWDWAGHGSGEPDVVLAAAGDIPTMEILAAAEWLRDHAPDLTTRVVNIVDLMTLFPPEHHPHGMNETEFIDLFTARRPVIFAFHGYQRAIHEIVHGRANAERFHVRGFNEQGTTTTPFDMVSMNGMSRYHLCIEAIRRSPNRLPNAQALTAELQHQIQQASAYSREHYEDPPEITNWRWS